MTTLIYLFFSLPLLLFFPKDALPHPLHSSSIFFYLLPFTHHHLFQPFFFFFSLSLTQFLFPNIIMSDSETPPLKHSKPQSETAITTINHLIHPALNVNNITNFITVTLDIEKSQYNHGLCYVKFMLKPMRFLTISYPLPLQTLALPLPLSKKLT